MVRWLLVGTGQAAFAARVAEQDQTMITVRQRALSARAFRLLSSLYYFHRSDDGAHPVDLRAITWWGASPVLHGLLKVRLGGLLGPKCSTGKVLPEPQFDYGDDVATEARFWQFLRWLSVVACDILAADPKASRRMALDAHYERRRRTPALRLHLEPVLAAQSQAYRDLLRRGLAGEFWACLSFVGKGQPWDHFYFHLVLAVDPDAGYQPSGVERNRGDLERELGL